MKTSRTQNMSHFRSDTASPSRAKPAAAPSRKRESIRTSGKRVRRQRTMRARGRA
jgi:hypothetical protein